MIRNIVYWIMVSSFFALGLCDLKNLEYRTAIASLLLGVVQLLIFWR
jgi:hypothetical protein